MIAGVIATAAVLALMLLLHKILDTDKHFIFQLLILVFFMVGSLLILPKMVIDSYAVCEPVVANTTVAGNLTTYEYARYCFERPEGTGVTFYNLATTMFYLFIGYFVVYLGFWAMLKLRDSVKGGKQ